MYNSKTNTEKEDLVQYNSKNTFITWSHIINQFPNGFKQQLNYKATFSSQATDCEQHVVQLRG